MSEDNPGYPRRIGKVTKVYNPAQSGARVVVVDLTDDKIHIGDTVSWGNPDENTGQQVASSIQVSGFRSPTTPKGTQCGIAVEGDNLPPVGTEVFVTKPTQIAHRDAGARPIRTVYQTPD